MQFLVLIYKLIHHSNTNIQTAEKKERNTQH